MKKLYGVIGDPIAHSLSPAMHNRELKELGMNGYYHPFRIAREDLNTAIKGMKILGIEGFNVTVPHKTAIIPCLDEIDPLAEAIGAVNTVVRSGERFIGYNTDGLGFIEALREEWKQDITDEPILIIGAGGAAKAIYFTLLSLGVRKVDICNRTLHKAEALIDGQPYKCSSRALTLEDAESSLGDYSLVIQTTSIGMDPDRDCSPISMQRLNPSSFVSDIIYNPRETLLLKQASKRGAKTQNGLGMLVYQGALAFEKWTGVQPDVQRMKQTVTDFLGGS